MLPRRKVSQRSHRHVRTRGQQRLRATQVRARVLDEIVHAVMEQPVRGAPTTLQARIFVEFHGLLPRGGRRRSPPNATAVIVNASAFCPRRRQFPSTAAAFIVEFADVSDFASHFVVVAVVAAIPRRCLSSAACSSIERAVDYSIFVIAAIMLLRH